MDDGDSATIRSVISGCLKNGLMYSLDPDLFEPLVNPSEEPPEGCEMLLLCCAATLAFGFRLRV